VIKKNFSFFQRLSWLLMVVVIIGVIATGIITNITLRSVEKKLPGILLKELNDLSLVLENLSEVVHIASIAKNTPSSDNIKRLQKKIELVYEDIVKLRDSYVFDNIVQASAFHAVVAPAIADLQIWLLEGISGLPPESKTVTTIISLRIEDAYQKALLQNRETRIIAQKILVEQQNRLGNFVFNANLLFVLTIIVVFMVIYLLIQQYILQIRESKAQSQLQISEEKYRRLMDNSKAMIYRQTLPDGRYEFVSPASIDITGYTPDEIYKDPMHIRNVIHPDWAEYIENQWNKLLKGEIPPFYEFQIIHKSGEIRWIHQQNILLYDQSGSIIATEGIVTDQTSFKRTEEKVRDAHKILQEQNKLALVGKIAGKMAHDFNNILGVVMGNTELALLDCEEPKTRKKLELVFEQTLRGKNLTRNLVAFAKDQEPKQEFFNLHAKIELVLNLLRKDLEGISINREDSPAVPDLLADPGMIEHTFVNLVQNSIHATSMVEQPRIIIRTFHKDQNIYIEIEDNGCGIPEEALDRIYEPAFTIKGSRDITGSYKPGIKGTGYGMTNVKKYIEQHKGNISVDSKIGKGTTIRLCFPVIKKELTQNEIVEIQKKNFSFEKHILLVEDEPAISDVQYSILTHKPCNHKVDVAANGQTALDLFNKNQYDFVSLDYVLKGELTGMDVYKQIRQTNQTIPILFVSGNLDFLQSIRELKNQDSYVDHVSKPCQNKDYVNATNELLREI
jgi:two-component system, cell cycle sensor histidine kinase and response regulator CckA